MIRYHLKKKLHMAGKAFLVVLAFLLTDSMNVHAMEPTELQLTVLQEFTLTSADALPENGSEVTYRLISDGSKEAPLPGNASEYYEFVIKGNQQLKLEKLRYTKTGIYEYVLKRTAPETVKGYTYDNEEYKIIVQVTKHLKDGQWQLKTEWIIQDGSGEKQETALYRHSYKGKQKEPETPEKVTDVPENVSESIGSKAAKTGDTNNAVLYLGIAGFALIAILLIWYMKRKKNKENK